MEKKIFTRRTTAPTADNKYYVHYSKGGYNTACIIDKNTGMVMKNCVGYAQGRWKESQCDKNVWGIGGNNFAGNAETFYANAKKAGLQVGLEPKLGAIMCWSQGKAEISADGAGHVAFVEAIKDNKDVTATDSSYYNDFWREKTFTAQSGYKYNDGFKFLGFIYPPVEFVLEEKKEVKTTSIKLSKTTATMYVGEDLKLTSTVKPTTSTQGVSWSTSDGKIATVKNGKVTAVKKGTVIIKAKSGSKIATTTITVKAAVIKAGAKFELKNVSVYESEDGKSVGKRTGTYYIWSTTVVNGRIRMTNSKDKVGKAGQVSFFVDKTSLI